MAITKAATLNLSMLLNLSMPITKMMMINSNSIYRAQCVGAWTLWRISPDLPDLCYLPAISPNAI